MPTFLIRGANSSSAADVTLHVQAEDEDAARETAARSAVLVTSVEQLPEVIGDPHEASAIERRRERPRDFRPRPREYRPRLEHGHVRGAPVINVAMPRRSSSLGIVSVILGVIAIVLCWIPLVGMIAIPIAILGVLFAGGGAVGSLFRRGSSVGYPAAGMLLNLVALVAPFVVSWAMFRGLQGVAEVAEAGREHLERTNQTVIPADPSEPVSAEARWAPVDATLAQGDARVRILGVRVGQVMIESSYDEPYPWEDVVLVIDLEVANVGTNRKIDYYPWRRDLLSEAELVDNLGNEYRKLLSSGMSNPVGGARGTTPLYPGESVRDVLVFERPVGAASELRLELPAVYFDGEGVLRVAIPMSSVARE